MEIKTKPRRRRWLDTHLAPPFQWTLITLFCGFILWIMVQLAGVLVDEYFRQPSTSGCGPTSTVAQAPIGRR